MISSAVLIVLLAGGVPTVKILADQAEVKQKEQQEATRLADIKATEEAEAARQCAQTAGRTRETKGRRCCKTGRGGKEKTC